MDIFEIFGHLTYIMIACSLLVRDMLWLRCLSILASVFSIVFNYYVPAAPLWLVIEWNVVFIGINAVRIGIILKEKMGVSFSPEEEELYETMFGNFSAVEFMKLMRLGQWREVEPGETLATEGEELASLVLIYNGAAGVCMKGEEVAVLKDGNFIGEMSFTTSGPASATVATVAATRVVQWSKEELKKLLQRNPSMRSAIQAVLSGDMARKLIEQSTGDGLNLGAAEAERRQITVMFCDLVGSTPLSERLDPEDLREVLRSYQEVCAGVIRRFEGFIARYFGDGLLVYFGYPRAYEDGAERAVRSGLGIVEELARLNPRLEREKDVHLQVRIGIHTGLVVVGDMDAEEELETMAVVGETPNVAARLQGLAEPDALVISAATYRLIADAFALRSLGSHQLRGISQPLEVYQVLHEREDFEVAEKAPLVGREQEVGLLMERWEQAREGLGQVVLLSGEGGIGKSRLIQVLRGRALQEGEGWLAECRCSPYDQNSAFYPIIDLCARILRFERDDGPQERTAKLETFLAQCNFDLAEVMPLFADLLSLPLTPGYVRYSFKHALLQDVAYQSLLKSRRQQYHQRIAQVLEERFPETAQTQPELLARHYTEAVLGARAVHYWQSAGERALERSANVEAVDHLRQGLAVLDDVEDAGEKAQRELDLQVALGAALIATRGPGDTEVGAVYSQARVLCEELGDPPQLFPVFYGLWVFHFVRAELQKAREQGEQFLFLAQKQEDPAPVLMAHRVLGIALFSMGAVGPARGHFEQLLGLYDAARDRALAFRYGQDPGMAGLCFLAWTLWLLGYAERARQKMDEALTHAHNLDHPPSLAYALVTAAMFHQQRREVREAQEQAEAAVALATEQQLPFWLAYANTLRGWALTAQGHDEQGMELMRQGMEAFQATGAQVWQPFFFLLQAEACGRIGQCAEGLDFLTRALEAIERSGEQLVEAEVYRLRGELLLDAASGDEDAVEVCYRRAIEVAQGQNARSLQLRASASLCELLRERGRGEEGQQLLEEIYGWFGEGFESADLKAARALLHGMGGGTDV